ncbi:MATE family efflux transporter [Marinisporobacter balticus]|uniref:Probable multidrug resistance protein NorM n=1 Tax=Marinisporobacter balticus TaxID=2018667 RepID=A0A4R2KCP6_9FIRM|nr:MATE family efflux transporter [Marinisporobacter balticus]TCO70684.1 putative MATE family efflux protein [Marinisporobacter balticus]
MSDLNKENKMGKLPIKKLLFTMSMPAILAMLVQACYNIVDSLFIARVNEAALSAVTLAFPIQMIIIAVCVGGGVGINSVISRKLGEGKNKEADNVAEHGILIMSLVYLAVLVIAFLFSHKMFNNFSNNKIVVDYGITYIRIILNFSFGCMLAQAGMSILQGTGDMLHPMKAQLIGAISNIILDPILIFGYFGLPAMGVAGAAIATVTGQILSMVYIYIILFTKENYIKLNLRDFSFSFSVIKQILKIGIPACIMQGVMSVMLFGMNWILAGYNDLASTALGIYYKLQSLIFLPVIGLGQGILPIIGYNYGAKNKDRISETIKTGCLWAISFMTFGFIVFQIFPYQLLAMFNSSSELTTIAVRAFRVSSLSFPMAGITIVLSNAFQGMEKAHYSMFLSIIRQFIVLIPVSYVLGRFFGLEYLWFGFLTSETIGFIVAILMEKLIYSKKLSKYELGVQKRFV